MTTLELEPGEVWRPIADFPRYEVSDRGRVRNVQTDRVLVPHIRRGYHSLIIRDGAGEKRDVRIHRLVAAAFLGPAHGLPVARHLDGNPLNNTAENRATGSAAPAKTSAAVGAKQPRKPSEPMPERCDS